MTDPVQTYFSRYQPKGQAVQKPKLPPANQTLTLQEPVSYVTPPQNVQPMNVNNVFDNALTQGNNIGEISALRNEMDVTRNAQNDVAGYLSDYERRFTPYLDQFSGEMRDNLGKSLGELSTANTTFQSFYGPQGEQRKRLEDLYAGQAQYLANEQARQEGSIDGSAANAGLSPNAIRLAKSDVSFNIFKQLSEVKAREVADYATLYDKVNAHLDNLVKTGSALRDSATKAIFDRTLEFRANLEGQLLQNKVALRNAQFELDMAAKARTAAGIGGVASGNTNTNTTASVVTGNFNGDVASANEYWNNNITPAYINANGQVYRNNEQANLLLQ